MSADDLEKTRAAYDTVADDYERSLRHLLETKPYDRAMLATATELVAGLPTTTIVDVGCGPGRVTAHLASLGAEVRGRDLSAGMISVARTRHPDLDFDVGTLDRIDARDGDLGGIVAWYSIIHTPIERLAEVFTEFARVLVSRGVVALAFQIGDGPRHISAAYGHKIDLPAQSFAIRDVVAELDRCGFEIEATLTRKPDADERLAQGYVVARKR